LPALLNTFYTEEPGNALEELDILFELSTRTDTYFVDNTTYESAAKCAADEMTDARFHSLLYAINTFQPSKPFAAQLLSAATPGAGQWLLTSSMPYFGAGVPFHEAEFLEVVRHRLGIPFAVTTSHEEPICSCHQRTNLRTEPMHPLICPLNKGTTIARHDAVRDRLAKLIRTVLPRGNVQLEPLHHQGRQFIRRPDLSYDSNGETHYIDVVVAEPTSATAVNHPQSSCEHAGQAAFLAEERKTQEYRRIDPDSPIKTEFFAVEATGRLGQRAKELLAHICRDQGHLLRAFYHDLAFLLAASRGRLISGCRRRLIDRG
jgi:hypothetical protein